MALSSLFCSAAVVMYSRCACSLGWILLHILRKPVKPHIETDLRCVRTEIRTETLDTLTVTQFEFPLPSPLRQAAAQSLARPYSSMPVHIRKCIFVLLTPVCRMRKWRKAWAPASTGHAAVLIDREESDVSRWWARSVCHVWPSREPWSSQLRSLWLPLLC